MQKKKKRKSRKLKRVHVMYRFDAKIGWEKEYEFIKKVEEENKELNFFTKLPPLRNFNGKKLYAYYKGEIKGYWIVIGKVLRSFPKCEETGRRWPSGWYIVVGGKFFEPEQKIIYNRNISRTKLTTYCEEIF